MRLKKMTTLLLAGVMAVGMIAGTAGTAMAEDYTGATNVGKFPGTGTYEGVEKPADVTLTKNFVMDASLTTPAETFKFDVGLVKVDDVAATTEEKNALSVAQQSIAYTATDTGTVAGDTKTVTKTVKGFLPTIDQFPHAGVYEFTAIESEGSTSEIAYSNAEYTIRVYVENDSTATNGLKFAGVTVEKTKKDQTADTDTVPAKVNPSEDGKGFAFRNDYTKTAPLQIWKTVAGQYGDKTKQFNFSATLTLPSTNKTMTTVTGTVYKDGTAVTPARTYKFDFTSGVATNSNIKLADGEYVNFTGENALPVGTTYSVTETGVAGYQPQGSYTYSGTTDKKTDLTEGTAGEAYPVSVPKAAGNELEDTTTVGEGNNNKVEITNTYKDITPTGILINNLPFILMILVAIGGVVAYMTLKRRHAVR